MLVEHDYSLCSLIVLSPTPGRGCPKGAKFSLRNLIGVTLHHCKQIWQNNTSGWEEFAGPNEPPSEEQGSHCSKVFHTLSLYAVTVRPRVELELLAGWSNRAIPWHE